MKGGIYMLSKKKFSLLFSIIFILTLTFGTLTYAAAKPTLDTPSGKPTQVRYAILDGITYGLSFSNDNRAHCYASGDAGAATKFIVSGTLQKYNSNGHLDIICNWPERTYNGQNFDFYEYALCVTPGEYLFTIYVDVYKGTQHESLVFYKNNTKNN